MKSFLVIGLGTFAHHLVKELSKTKCEIVIADKRAEAMEDLLKYVVGAKVCDCTNPDVLKTLGIPTFDACFVCVDSNFQVCLEITDQLKELGAKVVYSKSDRELETKFLKRSGADFIVYPDRDVAERIAVKVSSDRIFDFIGLSNNCALCEIGARREWIGKSVSELGFRAKYNLNLVAVKIGEKLEPVVNPNYVFKEDEHIFVMGSMDEIRKIT